jgi:nicotinic acid mononucleotide adenylyltransferase
MGAFGSYIQLTEAKRDAGAEPKTAVFTFGRFNPPTRGHAKLIATVERIAKEIGGDPFVFVSRAHDPDKNPLTFEDKLVFMRKTFPDTNIIENDRIKNPFNASGFLGSHLKYTDIILVVGSDRINEFQKRFTNPDKYFDSFKVVSAGDRDPDSDDIIGMSGTKARSAAARNDLGAFRAATGWGGETSLDLMRAVQRGMQDG